METYLGARSSLEKQVSAFHCHVLSLSCTFPSTLEGEDLSLSCTLPSGSLIPLTGPFPPQPKQGKAFRDPTYDRLLPDLRPEMKAMGIKTLVCVVGVVDLHLHCKNSGEGSRRRR